VSGSFRFSTAAYFLRATFPWLNLPPLEEFSYHLWLFPVVGVLGPLMLASQGFYERPRLTSRISLLLVILRAGALTTFALIVIVFLLRVHFARSVILLVGGFAGVLVYARHEFIRWFEETRVASEQFRRRVLWVGTLAENTRLRSALSAGERDLIVDAGDLDPQQASPEDLRRRLHEEGINAVVLSLVGVEPARLAPLLTTCEREGVEVIVRPGLSASSPHRFAIDQLGGEPVLYYRAQAAPRSHLVIKQVIDYVGAIVLLVVFAPIIVLVALAIRITSGAPVLYTQNRAGLNGRPFTLFKFRTMTVDAEKRQAELAGRNEMTGPVFKVREDPRVTRLGRILRRHSLDELPQLWNVLRGEMSLVGPRPLPVEEVARFDDHAHRRRLSVRPGLTCLWQISGRNDIADFNDWVRLDLDYIDQWSLWLDLKILVATIPVMLLGRGGR
jgi:exopolysaccharide biosynthesis polyprenyl glycosylphosphotransferase